MKLFLVDDNALFLEGLRNMLQVHGLEVVGMAASAEEALDSVAEINPDCVLMDIQMPGRSGIEATRILKANYPQLKIVLITIAEDENYLYDAIASGASGYLLKSMPGNKFIEALRGIEQGEVPLSPGLVEKIFDRFAQLEESARQAEQPAILLLSERQIEVLHHVALGLRYREIAEQLDIREATVKYHMKEIMNRLHLQNRAMVMAWASEVGLLRYPIKPQK